MDFVILKVNGQDVSNASHEDAVRCFQSAHEPIIVEVLRRHPSTMSTTSTTPANGQQTSTPANSSTTATAAQDDEPEQPKDQPENGGCNAFTLLVSTGVQTDWAGLIDDEDFMPTLHADEQTNDSFDDILDIGHDIDFEEVTLRKAASAEKLGLTVCYSSGSGSEDADTEVYISEIVPESLAARDGRLREGDQILRVNGRDVANKEQTENLFAETKSAVTILVSRCLYPDDDYDDRRIYQEGSPTLSPEATTPAYQNSLIEQLIRQQQELDEQTPTRESAEAPAAAAAAVVPPPPVPMHTGFSEPSSTCSSQSGSQKSSGAAGEGERRKWMQEALKECTRRVDGMAISQKTTQTQQQQPGVKLVEAYSSHVWSDTEHIYETIPESDSEPIYSSPYEHQHWLHQPNNNQQIVNNQTTSNGKPWHSSSKSNSSGEEKDSSSAYNTGESCNSNTLTLELQQPSEHHRSTLVLCPPKPGPTLAAAATSTPKMHCNCPVPLTPLSKSSKTQSTRRSTVQQQQQQQQQQPQQQPQSLAAETMYTNVANLQQTMRLQQQLFKQALSRRKSGAISGTRDSSYTRRSRTAQPSSFQAPNLAQYQFVASHQVTAPIQQHQTWAVQPQVSGRVQQQHQQQQEGMQRGDPVQMEWKVKRRSDGTRYIARRPVRNRILRNRALRISEERQGHTTEDDALSEIKVGRYWSKEERKRQLERARERKQRQQELIQQQQQQQQQNQQQQQQTSEVIIEESQKPLSKKPPTCGFEHKKQTRKKPAAPALDDFTTVQEILVHGNRSGVGSAGQNPTGKLMGLLSVTTV